jgi:hypothetical protein
MEIGYNGQAFKFMGIECDPMGGTGRISISQANSPFLSFC